MAECWIEADFFAGQGDLTQESWRISSQINAAPAEKDASRRRFAIFQTGPKARLADGSSNAILVADDILTACKYYELFQQKNFRKCVVISSYEPSIGDLRTEMVSDNEETDAYEKFRIYLKMFGIDLADTADKSGIAKQVEEFEKTAKKEIHRRAL